MENAKLIYNILALLNKWLDDPKPDYGKLEAANFAVSEKRFAHILMMLYNAGYIDGIEFFEVGAGEYDFKCINPTITLRGLEYLETNDTMHKAYRAIKGIKDILPM